MQGAASWLGDDNERTAPNLAPPAGIYRLDRTDTVTRRMNMKRSGRWSGSPTAAVMMVSALLATACGAGPGVASPTHAPASLAAGPATSAPATASVSSASPSRTPSPVDVSDGSLEAGTTYFIYDSRVDGPRWVVLTVPATGWVSNDWIIFKNLPGSSDSHVIALSTWTIGNLKVDPCNWKAGALDPRVGPTVEDLAAALVKQPGPAKGTSTDATLGGYRGKKVEFSIPSNFDSVSCDEGVFSRWEAASEPGDWGGWIYGAGMHNAVYIIDVDGRPVVIDTMSLLGASAADLAELEQIIASIRFERRASSQAPSPDADPPFQLEEGRDIIIVGLVSPETDQSGCFARGSWPAPASWSSMPAASGGGSPCPRPRPS